MVKGYTEDAKTEPSFLFDVMPFFFPTFLTIMNLVVYQMSTHHNALIWVFLIFTATPLYNYFILDDSTNLKKNVERKWEQYSMFNVPVWTCIFTACGTWIYGLILYSDEPFWTEFK